MSAPESSKNGPLVTLESRLREGRTVRRQIPGVGRVAIDRPLPFVVLYRRPANGDPGTDRLVVGSASWVLADGAAQAAQGLTSVIQTIGRVSRDTFGSFLIIEVWAGPPVTPGSDAKPGYRVLVRDTDTLASVSDELRSALALSRILGLSPDLSVERSARVAPPGLRQVLDGRKLASLSAHIIGIEVRPVYRSTDGGLFPGVLRQMRRRMTTAIDRAAYRFTHDYTSKRPETYLAMGKRSFARSAKEIDAELAAIGESYDFLLQVSPVNVEEAFRAFARSRFQRAPQLRYRPLPFDPGRMKHRLWAVRPERVEDPTLMYLFRGVQRQLDRELTALSDIGHPEFLHESLQIHGGVEPGLLALAREIIERLPPRPTRARRASRLTASEFAGLLTAEIASYRDVAPGFGLVPRVRDDVLSGVMVSHGRVLVGSGASIPTVRADALIQHEVGTHVVTWHNARQQPLKLLAVGLPGSDELQEGLAVFGEYLVGGLDDERLRMLAGRVLAVDALIGGAEFVECYRLLRDLGFGRHTAFGTAVRVYRAGGLTKDAMYLRGLASVLDLAAEGADLSRLFIGKFGMRHLEVVNELLTRKVLSPPAVLPRYLHRDDAAVRLEVVRGGVSVADLVKGRARR